MCLGWEGIILSVQKEIAVVGEAGVERTVSVGMIDDVQEGDRVMVHAGTAIAKVTNSDENETEQLLSEL